MSVVILVAGGLWLVRLSKLTRILARLAPAIAAAPYFYALLDRSTTSSHSMERHGPLLRDSDVSERAITGPIAFSQFAGRPDDSARWFPHSDLLLAIDSALAHRDIERRPKGGVFDFRFEYPIGAGFPKHSGDRLETTVARVIVRKGAPITAYPVLRPKQQTPFEQLQDAAVIEFERRQ